VWQFLSESFLYTVLSFILALAFVGLFLPFFDMLLDKNYQLAELFQPVIVIGSGALILIVTLLAGYYPAWVISAVRPAEILKGKMQSSSRGVQLRRSLVVFQFVISVGLVLCTFVVIRQLEFMRNEDLGFHKEQVIVVNSSHATVNDRSVYRAFKNDLQSLASVQRVTCTNSVPGRPGWRGQISYSEITPKGESVSVEYLAVDEDYVETLGMKVIAGRNFDEKRETDLKDGLLINETAASLYGWTIAEAIDRKITSPSGYPAGTVIGVVKDYHQSGLQQRIGPVVMDINPGRYYAIRFLTEDTGNLIARLQVSWKKWFPENEFNYFFLDEDFERQYQTEKRLANVFEVFSGLTILIAVMYANNEIGVIQPIRAIGQIARKHGVLFFTDAAQAVGKVPVDVNGDGIDLMAVSAHKLYGPKGIGALYVRRKDPRVRLTAQMDGGGHERGMRSGTLNVPAIVGFGKACELCRLEMEAEARRVSGLRDRLEAGLLALEQVFVNGSREHRLPHTTNLSFKYVSAEGLIMAINKDVALSSGSACTSASLEPSYVLKALGLEDDLAHSSLRFGLGRGTTEEEVHYVIGQLKAGVERLRSASPLWEMYKQEMETKKG